MQTLSFGWNLVQQYAIQYKKNIVTPIPRLFLIHMCYTLVKSCTIIAGKVVVACHGRLSGLLQ
jgi:hypothetical protein